jgi:hypothetical protein
MSQNHLIKCFDCSRSFELTELLSSAHDYWPQMRIVKVKTPCCGATEEIRVSNGLVERGYVYAAGAPHFSSEQPVEFEALQVVPGEDFVELVFPNNQIRVAAC